MTDHYEFLVNLLHNFSKQLGQDLAQCTTQSTRTTKHDRREKALAYLLDTLTSDPHQKFSSGDWCLSVLSLTSAMRHCPSPPTSPEVLTALDRIDKRLEKALQEPSRYISNKQACVGCGEVLDVGQEHECTNKSSIMKDLTMKRDDTIDGMQ